jgi:hypothetical protein
MPSLDWYRGKVKSQLSYRNNLMLADIIDNTKLSGLHQLQKRYRSIKELREIQIMPSDN